MADTKMILGVGDLGATSQAGAVIKTYALGSCVALLLYDRQTQTVGMAHIALPDSKIADGRIDRPGRFADTGVPELMTAMRRAGSRMAKGTISVKLAGGANVADTNNTFNIGKRNVLAIKKLLWKQGLAPLAEDVGSNHSRTVTAFRDTGQVIISCPGRKDWEI